MTDWAEPDPWWRRCNFVEARDGDTFRVRADLGFRIYHEGALRLRGVDTPEMEMALGTVNPLGVAAKEYAERWFGRHRHYKSRKWHYWIQTEREVTTYDRYVARVYCLRGHSLADDLVASGHALAIPETL